MKARAHFNFAKALSPEAVAARKVRMASALFNQTTDRIRAGGDEEVAYAPLRFPRKDGSTDHPLLGNGALLDTIHPISGPGFFGLASEHPGAKVQQHGTVGKGGALPTIVPRNGKVLALPGPGGRTLFVRHVDLPPRPYFRLTPGNRRELAETCGGDGARVS